MPIMRCCNVSVRCSGKQRSSPREWWCSVNSLSGGGGDASSLGISADELHKFFNDKVSALRASTSEAPATDVLNRPAGLFVQQLSAANR